jgi:uncharacterized protein YpuA (DUF1002 family)
MNRPEVRVIQSQEVVTQTESEMSQAEMNALLAKYGYKQDYNNQAQITQQTTQKPISFEEMVTMEENKRKIEEEKRRAQANAPKSVTFDQSRVGYAETKYGTIDDNLGIQISIVSDMNIPKY